jgi:hypothetical protein
MDGATNYPPGFIFRYYGDDLSQAPVIYTTEPTTTKAGGGIWMDGAGIAAGIDTVNGPTNLYFTTADGDFDTTTGGLQCVDCGDSFVKLTYGLGKVNSHFFAPLDPVCRFTNNSSNPDTDFGSGGVLLIPDNLLTSWPYLAVSADKEGFIWVMQRQSPGGFAGNFVCPATGSNGNLETVTGTGLYHNTPAFWQTNTSTGNLYYASVGGQLMGYPVASSCTSGTPPVCAGSPLASVDELGNILTFNPGTTPAVSSNAATAGIVWALSGSSVEGTNVGALYAFDATMMKQIYNSGQCQSGVDHMYSTTKFSVPTVANGYVYIGTQSDNVVNVGKGTFYIFGKLSRSSC